MRGVRSDDAPAPVGPNSQAVVCDGWIFASGQVPLDPTTGRVVEGDVAEQTHRVLENLRAVLHTAGAGPEDVVRTTIYLTDLDDFQRVNAIYAEHFPNEPQPARPTVGVAALPLGARIEVDCIARA